MLAIIFISMLVPMLVMGLPMVGSYAMAFLVPCLLSGQEVFRLSDLVGWLPEQEKIPMLQLHCL